MIAAAHRGAPGDDGGYGVEGVAYRSRFSAWSRSIDHWTITACLALFSIGVVLAFAASPGLAGRQDLDPFHYAWRHLMFGAPAFAALFAISFLGPAAVRRMGVALGIFGLVALALLPTFGVDHGKGATRWFSVFGVSLQPSEFAKPGIVILAAWLLTAAGARDRWIARLGVAASAGVVGGAVTLLVLQPDLGQAALLSVVWSAMFFVAGAPIGRLALIGALCAGVGVWAYGAFSHFRSRIDAFLDPSNAESEQIEAADRAIVDGGWFGRGLGEGASNAKLPDAHADFILAVAAVEYGFVLAAAIVLLFVVIVLRALWRLAEVEEPFARLAGVGLALLIGLQAFVNLGVAVQLLPAKGMTLPFVSYGGSSMVAMGVTMGLLLALSRRRPRDLASSA